MRVAIASGKGGTGKTTIATNLALIASRMGKRVAYLDCDVEEPNGHIFLRPTITQRTPVTESFPRVDRETCDLCGKCNELCQFSAIVRAGQQMLVYPDLCHACGGCGLVCPLDAITEASHQVGVVETGHSGAIDFAHGVLHVGRPRAVPIIKAVKSAAFRRAVNTNSSPFAVPSPPLSRCAGGGEGTSESAGRFQADLIILDSPPGTSCPVVETVRGADFVVLVTEPTPFAFHDLTLAVDTMQTLGLPCGVVVNRAGTDGAETHSYCRSRKLPILAEIPDDLRLAKACSGGLMAVDVLLDSVPLFQQLLTAVEQRVRGKTYSQRVNRTTKQEKKKRIYRLAATQNGCHPERSEGSSSEVHG